MAGILIIFHTGSNTGYAMTPLEKTFFKMAFSLTKNEDHIHFSFKNFNNGHPDSLPENFSNLIAIDNNHPETLPKARDYILQHKIDYAFCFDLQVSSDIGSMLRACNVKKIISYWGATISGENSGLKLLLKKIEVLLNRKKPDHFIFESEAMRFYAVQGRGIPKAMTSVIPTGIDIEKYQPENRNKNLLNQLFSIPEEAKVVFYSGHMERRKGVHVIIDAAIEIVEKRGQENIYFLITGNKPGEEKDFLTQLGNSKAAQKVIFGGYRTDLDKIMPSCDLGVIASTGWDSFPMSSLEMAACGLPLIVSDLQGLTETITEEVTGLKFPPGDSKKLAEHIIRLLTNHQEMQDFSLRARQRIIQSYSVDHQLDKLLSCCGKVFK